MFMLSRDKNLNPQSVVILRNKAIQTATTETFVSVIVDQHLNLKDHISMISQNKIMWHVISRIRNRLDIQSRNTFTYYIKLYLYLTY